MSVLESKIVRRFLEVDFWRFCLVGGSGFVINFVLLVLLHKVWGMPAFFGQLIASEIALFSNFLLHNYWTYKRSRVTKTIPTLLWQFHASSWVAILGSASLVAYLVDSVGMHFFLALIISSVLALLWNFVWTKFIIWRHEHEQHHKEETEQ